MIHLYFIKPPEKDRWIRGDRHIRKIVRRIIRGAPRIGGVEKVFVNLKKSFDRLGVTYKVNTPYNEVKPDDPVIVLGVGKYALKGFTLKQDIIAGIGLMTHPTEWPDLCQNYPVKAYLQHSDWVNNVFRPFFGSKCMIWPVGIDTYEWSPTKSIVKSIDVLIYNKIMWEKPQMNAALVEPIKSVLSRNSILYEEIRYGHYRPEVYKQKLQNSKCMIFLCEHESQGIALQEAMAMDIPILAWNQGYCLDPNRFVWNDPEIPASSVPYFDETCGKTFKDLNEFEQEFNSFWNNVVNNTYHPRTFVLKHLSLEKSGQRMLEIIYQIYPDYHL